MIEQLLSIPAKSIKIADIGAAFYDQVPLYERLLANGLGELFAFEPDKRELPKLRRHLEGRGHVIDCAVGDGNTHTYYACADGMSSLLEPDPLSLGFFNEFSGMGTVNSTLPMPTRRLDDINELPQIDFLKIDVQGSELMILENGRKKLADCVALQTEVSFAALYKNQPTFGDIDRELRSQGMIPHCFAEFKRWPIAPFVLDGNPRLPLNQMLEGDIIYMRDIIRAATMTDVQLAKLAIIAHFICNSPDLATRCLLELEGRKACQPDTAKRYVGSLATKA